MHSTIQIPTKRALSDEQIYEYAHLTEQNCVNSDHPPHLMSCGLVHPGQPQHGFRLTNNNWPAAFAKTYAHAYIEFGKCSQTAHAEHTNLMKFPGDIRGTHMFLFPFCCPNCAKDIIIGGVDTLYIDKRSHDSHYGLIQAAESAETKNPFDNFTLPLLVAYGVNVFETDPASRIINPLCLAPPGARILPPYQLYTAEFHSLEQIIRSLADHYPAHKDWSVAKVKTKDGHECYLITEDVPPPEHAWNMNGLSLRMMNAGKFSAIIDSFSNLVMTARREDLEIQDATVATNLAPYPRSLVHAALNQIKLIPIARMYQPCDRLPNRLDMMYAFNYTGAVTFNNLNLPKPRMISKTSYKGRLSSSPVEAGLRLF